MTLGVYVCLFGAVVARLLVGISPVMSQLSGILWLAAFGGFMITYRPLLLRPKPERGA